MSHLILTMYDINFKMVEDYAEFKSFKGTKYSTIINNYHQRYSILVSTFKQDILYLTCHH